MFPEYPEYGYYQIVGFERCPFFYFNFVQRKRGRRSPGRQFKSVVGDAVHAIIQLPSSSPQAEEATTNRIEDRLPAIMQQAAKVRTKRHVRVVRQMFAQHAGKVTRKTYRWLDDGKDGLGCLIYSTPDRILEDGNVWTIIEVKTGEERSPVVRETLRDHLRFHGIVAASAAAQSLERMPRIHLVGYALGREALAKSKAASEKSGERDLSGLKPTFDFWYSWKSLLWEQDEVRARILPIMQAEAKQDFTPVPNASCPSCDYIETSNCLPGQDHVRVLAQAKAHAHLVHVNELLRKAPQPVVIVPPVEDRKQA